MVKLLATAALLAAGCEAALSDNGGNGNVDANGSGSNQIDAPTQQQIDAPPACANGRKLFLNFDGVTVTQGTPSDATQNRVSWMSNANATMPAYHTGVTGRVAEIASITNGVRSRLAATPIELVTTRPASGPYVMVVLGGTGGQIGTPYTYATNEHDCGDTVKSDVGWIGDLPDVDYVPDLVPGTLGWGVGLNGTNDPAGCMCGWANGCTEDAAAACTLSASIASTTSSGNTTCANQNPQNEIAALTTGFCQ